MHDRLKGARQAETEPSDRRPDEAKFDSGLPRFQPQAGGFGRRATPVGTAPANQPKEIEVSPGTSAQPQFRKPANSDSGASATQVANGGWTKSAAITEAGQTPGQTASGQTASGLGDIPTRIADWLMREVKDQRGIHCETILTVVGALAGYSAQQALWEGMVKPGKLAITQAFKVVETNGGATYFFGEALDTLLTSVEPKHLSIWKIVAGGALTSGGDRLPDVDNLLRHCAATVGTSAFGLPRLPDDHLPSIMPRTALEEYWPGARLLLGLAEPLHWPLHMANAAHKLIQSMKGSIAQDLAVCIVMEAAVPMSRIDPATVPND